VAQTLFPGCLHDTKSVILKFYYYRLEQILVAQTLFPGCIHDIKSVILKFYCYRLQHILVAQTLFPGCIHQCLFRHSLAQRSRTDLIPSHCLRTIAFGHLASVWFAKRAVVVFNFFHLQFLSFRGMAWLLWASLCYIVSSIISIVYCLFYRFKFYRLYFTLSFYRLFPPSSPVLFWMSIYFLSTDFYFGSLLFRSYVMSW